MGFNFYFRDGDRPKHNAKIMELSISDQYEGNPKMSYFDGRANVVLSKTIVPGIVRTTKKKYCEGF